MESANSGSYNNNDIESGFSKQLLPETAKEISAFLEVE